MSALISSVFAGVITAFFGAGTPVTTVDYTCDPLVWVDAPTVTGNYFTGTLRDNCRLKRLSRSGFVGLRKSVETNVVSEAETVHSGPTAEKYDGLSGVAYDVTVYGAKDGMEVRVRGDNHIATDDTHRLLNDFISTKVSGTGFAAYLKESSAFLEVLDTSDSEWFTSQFDVQVKIEKPPFFPSSSFKTEVQTKMEKEMKDNELKLVTEIAENL